MSLWHCAEHGVYGPEGPCPTCGKPGAIVTGALVPCGSITFDVVPTADTELTCVACWMQNCTHEFRIRSGGSTQWTGIHEKCFDTFRLRNPDVELQEPPPQGSHLAGSRGPGGDSCGSDEQEAVAELVPYVECCAAAKAELRSKLTAAEADNAELHIRLAAAQQRLLELDPRASTPPPAGDGEA